MKVVLTLEQVAQKSCEISIFWDSHCDLNWPYFLGIELENFGSSFWSKLFHDYLSLSVLILITSSLLQNVALGFLKQGQLERSSLLNSFVVGMWFLPIWRTKTLQCLSLHEQL